MMGEEQLQRLTTIENSNDCPSRYIRAMASEILALRCDVEQLWQPIETAPKDKRILVWSGQEICAAHWAQNPITGDEAWVVAEWGQDGDQALVKPTYWQSLPTPPE